MAEPRPFEDEATLYVLGQLGPGERHQFEARMDKSRELRALVHELEAGTVALALTTPRRQPPAQVWERIREAVTAEEKGGSRAPFFAWLRSGWAAAACVAIGWSIYVLWTNRSATPATSRPTVSSEVRHAENAQNDSGRRETPGISSQPQTPGEIAPPPVGSLARAGEIAGLRRQVWDLESQLAHLSQVLTQQQTMPAQAGKFMFLSMAPPGVDGGPGRTAGAPAPELQRALLIALARDLGWKQLSVQERRDQAKTGDGDPMPTSDPGVEFIELPLDGEARTQVPSATQNTQKSTPVVAKTDPSPVGDADTANPSGSAIPGYQFGTNVVLAIGSSVVPPGTDSLTVWAGTATGEFQSRGSLTVGNSPTVVRIPFLYTVSGWNIAVTAGAGTGPPASNNTIGIFTAP